MPDPNATQHDADALLRPDSSRSAACEPAAPMCLVDVRYRTMTAEEDRAAVAAVAALVRALQRSGDRPARPDER